MGRTTKVHSAVMGITLVATLGGAILQFSKLFDTKTIEGVIEKFSGNPEGIKLVLAMVAGIFTSLVTTLALEYKSRARTQLKNEEDKKYQVIE